MQEPRIEICANSAESAVEAQKGGAYRVELCAGIPEGGTTPSWGEIQMARQRLSTTKLHVIIRPRGGDFLYTQDELQIMKADIEQAVRTGVDGVVFGCLTAGGEVDVEAMRPLMEAARGVSVTFHRAFDMCRDPFKALEQIIELGCNRILTSGQEATAEKGIPLLQRLVQRASGRITIMPGCGVRPNNIRRIMDETGACEFHFSGRRSRESAMRYRNPRVSMGGTVTIEEYSRELTSPDLVAAAYDALK